jgi:hypothetical protein
MKYSKETIDKINKDIKEEFHHLFQITKDMKYTHDSISRLVNFSNCSFLNISEQ